jgi:hypothetical protein
MTIPYNNGKIKMGIHHQREPYIETDPDMILLQSYLIQDPKLIRRQYWLNKAYWGALALIVLIIWLRN